MDLSQGGSPGPTSAVPPAAGAQIPEANNTKPNSQNNIYQTTLSKQTYQTEITKPNTPNKHHQTNNAKPKLPNQITEHTYHTKITKPITRQYQTETTTPTLHTKPK